MKRRVLLLAALGSLLLFGSRATGKEAAFRPVTGWPSGGSAAPGYGTGAVSAVATDRQGRVFVFQRAPVPVLVFQRDGAFVRSWGAGEFTSPHGCRIDPEGNLWLTDNADHRVLKYTPEGKLLATFGTQGQAGEDATHFNKPTDVAFAPNGDFYVSDGYGNSRVVRFSRAGKYLGAWGRKGTGEGEFNLPHSVVIDRTGKVYVADRENARVQVFTAEGKFLTQWRDTGHPYGLYLTPDQRLLVTDGLANTLSVYDLNGKRLSRVGATGTGPGEYQLPHLLNVDDQGAVYVCEITGKRVQKLLPR